MAPSALIGTTIAGRFKVVELLGTGAMAEVYVAEHKDLERRYAIKFLRENIAADVVLVERFRREARAISRLEHPGIVSVVDFGRSARDQLFLVMEFVDGPSLQDVIEAAQPDRLPLRRSFDIVAQLARAAGAAHTAGVVHRDLKPENILLATTHAGRDQVKVLDFGLAKIMEGAEFTSLTSRGEIFGTPDYMPPEQARGEPVSPQSDIYSLGVVAYELCAGRPPFVASSMPNLLIAHQDQQPAPPSSYLPPEAEPLPDAVERIILQCLEKDPARRPGRAEDVAAVFAAQLEARGSKPRINVPPVKVGGERRLTSQSDWQEVTLDADTGVYTDPDALRNMGVDPAPPSEDPASQREWFWTQAVKKGRDLAQLLRDQRLGSVELIRVASELSDAEERTMTMETEIALAESRLAELDTRVREAEARLRYAVVDLSMERGRLQDEGADANVYADLDFQIKMLEQRLADLYRRNDEKKSELVHAIRLRQERLGIYQQKQTNREVRLINLVLSVRPPDCPSHILAGYTRLEDMLRSLKELTHH